MLSRRRSQAVDWMAPKTESSNNWMTKKTRTKQVRHVRTQEPSARLVLSLGGGLRAGVSNPDPSGGHERGGTKDGVQQLDKVGDGVKQLDNNEDGVKQLDKDEDEVKQPDDSEDGDKQPLDDKRGPATFS